MVYNYFWKEKRPPTEAYLQLEEQTEDHRPHSPCGRGRGGGAWGARAQVEGSLGGTWSGRGEPGEHILRGGAWGARTQVEVEDEQVAEQQQTDERQQQDQQPERQEDAFAGPHGGDREEEQPRVLSLTLVSTVLASPLSLELKGHKPLSRACDQNNISFSKTINPRQQLSSLGPLGPPPGTGSRHPKGLRHTCCRRCNAWIWYSWEGGWTRQPGGKVQTPASEPLWPLGPRLSSVSVCPCFSVRPCSAGRSGLDPTGHLRAGPGLWAGWQAGGPHSNVVILTTSNITERIDVAFVDRADIRQYIGPPSAAAIFKIYLSCLEELMRCQIIYPRQQLLTLRELEMIGFIENNVSKLSLLLSEISRKSEGLSGRVLRKLPFLAHALYIQAPTVTIEGFLQALSLAVDKQFEERKKLSSCV
ncbi:hypothetical protein FD755_018783 [Muntiacus reevesi]|uniref:Pachytene checkpoint protein 2 homolog n=1 Tax=Muntiacus reevesi TaxID=9886 RepID=A0A5N3X6H7_MUNRE|nr:hypothetical protein FD755_018783 [Muntiacus reevesi]